MSLYFTRQAAAMFNDIAATAVCARGHAATAIESLQRTPELDAELAAELDAELAAELEVV